MRKMVPQKKLSLRYAPFGALSPSSNKEYPRRAIALALREIALSGNF